MVISSLYKVRDITHQGERPRAKPQPFEGTTMTAQATLHSEPRYMRDDERSVVRKFVHHIQLCRVCQVHGGTVLSFCPRGYSYTKDVRQYLYMNKNKCDERVLSQIDLQESKTEKQVRVDDKYHAVINISRGRNRTMPTVRLRSAQAPQQHQAQDGRRTPVAYGDPEYVTLLARIPSITIPLEVRRSDLSKGNITHSTRRV